MATVTAAMGVSPMLAFMIGVIVLLFAIGVYFIITKEPMLMACGVIIVVVILIAIFYRLLGGQPLH